MPRLLRRPRVRRPDESRARTALAVVALLLTAAGWASLAVHAGSWRQQWLLVAAALSHQVMWAAVAGLAVALLARRFVVAAAAALAAVLVVLVQVPPTVASTAPSGPNARRLVVLQANLEVGGADPAALVRLVRDHDVDLLATEELTTVEQQRLLAAGLGRLLPHHFLRALPSGGGGTGIWSRWPLSATQDVPGFWLGTVRARVATPAGPVTFVGVHLTPPWPYPQRRWLDEAHRLRALLRQQPADVPVLAPGDYNATVGHAQFRALLTAGYADAASQAGAGYLPSYPADRWYGPVIGIDHLLTRDAVATAARTYDLPGSDHRALLVTVRTVRR